MVSSDCHNGFPIHEDLLSMQIQAQYEKCLSLREEALHAELIPLCFARHDSSAEDFVLKPSALVTRSIAASLRAPQSLGA